MRHGRDGVRIGGADVAELAGARAAWSLIADVGIAADKAEIARILKDEGFIEDFAEATEGPVQVLNIRLKYVGRVPVVSGLKRISKPGLRVYAAKTEIPRVLGGLGVVIVSTSQGIMTGAQAKRGQLGGEILAYVW